RTISRRSPSAALRLRRDLPPSSGFSFFIELPVDEIDQGGQRRSSAGTGRTELDLAADAGRQHHQPHDRTAFHIRLALDDADVGVIGVGDLHEFRGGAGVQTLLVLDPRLHDPRCFAPHGFATDHDQHSLALRSWEATLMYLRPASCAAVTAAGRLIEPRTEASLISIGRLTPAITSTFALSSTEIARLLGVPPNMSVSSTTPLPWSTLATVSRISLRRSSMSSSAPMQIAATPVCFPTTCSRAATNSLARLPWVTNTMPIIIPFPIAARRTRSNLRVARCGQDRDGAE